jgi:hypothetical protein
LIAAGVLYRGISIALIISAGAMGNVKDQRVPQLARLVSVSHRCLRYCLINGKFLRSKNEEVKKIE